jgi:hypothetical protein
MLKPESIATGVDGVLSPATKEAEPASVVMLGGPSTSTVSVAAVLLLVPSLTAKDTVLLPGTADEPAENVTADKAFAHCLSLDVAPDEVSVRTPVAAL